MLANPDRGAASYSLNGHKPAVSSNGHKPPERVPGPNKTYEYVRAVHDAALPVYHRAFLTSLAMRWWDWTTGEVPPISLIELSRLVGVSRSTVIRIVAEMRRPGSAAGQFIRITPGDRHHTNNYRLIWPSSVVSL